MSSIKRRRPKTHLWGVKTHMALELDGDCETNKPLLQDDAMPGGRLAGAC